MILFSGTVLEGDYAFFGDTDLCPPANLFVKFKVVGYYFSFGSLRTAEGCFCRLDALRRRKLFVLFALANAVCLSIISSNFIFV